MSPNRRERRLALFGSPREPLQAEILPKEEERSLSYRFPTNRPRLQRPGVAVISLIPILGLVGWLFQNFLSTRGIMSQNLSRGFLYSAAGLLWLYAAWAAYIWATWKKTVIVSALLIFLGGAVWLDIAFPLGQVLARKFPGGFVELAVLTGGSSIAGHTVKSIASYNIDVTWDNATITDISATQLTLVLNDLRIARTEITPSGKKLAGTIQIKGAAIWKIDRGSKQIVYVNNGMSFWGYVLGGYMISNADDQIEIAIGLQSTS
jgi:hypothetical protein